MPARFSPRYPCVVLEHDPLDAFGEPGRLEQVCRRRVAFTGQHPWWLGRSTSGSLALVVIVGSITAILGLSHDVTYAAGAVAVGSGVLLGGVTLVRQSYEIDKQPPPFWPAYIALVLCLVIFVGSAIKLIA
jgi:hypothetical protein